MASCRNCGTNVGCGCQLINGLCAACNAAVKKGRKLIQNVISKTYKLS
jgi:hypothetical protein